MKTDTPMLPGFEAQEKATSREEAISRHLDSLQNCWPEWEGPRPGGYCSVDTTIVWSITHGERRYHYATPCRLRFQLGPFTWLAVVEYINVPHCLHFTGELLRLDITEIWAPVGRLLAARARELSAA